MKTVTITIPSRFKKTATTRTWHIYDASEVTKEMKAGFNDPTSDQTCRFFGRDGWKDAEDEFGTYEAQAARDAGLEGKSFWIVENKVHLF